MEAIEWKKRKRVANQKDEGGDFYDDGNMMMKPFTFSFDQDFGIMLETREINAKFVLNLLDKLDTTKGYNSRFLFGKKINEIKTILKNPLIKILLSSEMSDIEYRENEIIIRNIKENQNDEEKNEICLKGFNDLVNSEGWTPLHEACKQKQPQKVLEFLVKMGCSIYKEDNGGSSALRIALENNKNYFSEVIYLYECYKKGWNSSFDKNKKYQVLPFILENCYIGNQDYQDLLTICFLIRAGFNPFQSFIKQRDNKNFGFDDYPPKLQTIIQKIFPSFIKDKKIEIPFTTILSLYELDFAPQFYEKICDSIFQGFGYSIDGDCILSKFHRNGLLSKVIIDYFVDKDIVNGYYSVYPDKAINLFTSFFLNNQIIKRYFSSDIGTLKHIFKKTIEPLLENGKIKQKKWYEAISKAIIKECIKNSPNLKKILFLVECGATIDFVDYFHPYGDLDFFQSMCYGDKFEHPNQINEFLREIERKKPHLYSALISSHNPLYSLMKGTKVKYKSIKIATIKKMLTSDLNNRIRLYKKNNSSISEEQSLNDSLEPVLFSLFYHNKESYICDEIDKEDSLIFVKNLYHKDIIYFNTTNSKKQNLLHYILKPLNNETEDNEEKEGGCAFISNDGKNSVIVDEFDLFVSNKIIDFFIKMKCPLNVEDNFSKKVLDYALINNKVHYSDFGRLILSGARLSSGIIIRDIHHQKLRELISSGTHHIDISSECFENVHELLSYSPTNIFNVLSEQIKTRNILLGKDDKNIIFPQIKGDIEIQVKIDANFCQFEDILGISKCQIQKI